MIPLRDPPGRAGVSATERPYGALYGRPGPPAGLVELPSSPRKIASGFVLASTRNVFRRHRPASPCRRCPGAVQALSRRALPARPPMPSFTAARPLCPPSAPYARASERPAGGTPYGRGTVSSGVRRHESGHAALRPTVEAVPRAVPAPRTCQRGTEREHSYHQKQVPPPSHKL